jgi:hypothetical protein
MTRGKKAGLQMAEAIIEMVNLMYQNNTAIRFLCSLQYKIGIEIKKREKEKKKK